MPRRTSALVAAAEDFEKELRAFEAVAKKTLEVPVDSQKRLDRAGQLLNDVVEAEGELRERLGALGKLLAEARQKHQQIAAEVTERAQAIHGRAETFRGLMQRLEALGRDVVPITEAARADEVDLAALQGQITAVAERAGQLEADAIKADFRDVAHQVRTRKEQLLALHAKLDQLKRDDLPEG